MDATLKKKKKKRSLSRFDSRNDSTLRGVLDIPET